MPDSVYESILALAAERLLELRLTRQILIPAPGAGAEIKFTCPGGVLLELLSFDARITTSAVVANRNASIRILDPDGNFVMRFSAGGPVPASSIVAVSYGAGIGAIGQFGPTMGSWSNPPFILYPGFTFNTATSGIDAGDTYSSSILTVRQWSETDIVQETGVIADQIQSLYGREVTGR